MKDEKAIIATIRQGFRNRRSELGITLEEVTRHLHYSTSYIGRWERGELNSRDIEARYAQFLNDCETGKIKYFRSQMLKHRCLHKASGCIWNFLHNNCDDPLTELKKARQYLNMEIQKLEAQTNA